MLSGKNLGGKTFADPEGISDADIIHKKGRIVTTLRSNAKIFMIIFFTLHSQFLKFKLYNCSN
jgi:hypothetical protein